MNKMKFRSSSSTHVGKVRPTNEDAFISRDNIGLWAVADGMGGHQAGDVASRQVVSSLESVQPGLDIESRHHATQQALQSANDHLLRFADKYDTARRPGSTVVALLLDSFGGFAIWAGDSRIYHYRNGSVKQVTVDHSHVQDLVREGLIRADEAESHPMANVITRAIGIGQTVKLDSIRLDVAAGDRFLLCSDGLSRLVSLEEIAHIMQEEDLEASVRSLLRTALAKGAPDNVTLICVACEEQTS